MNDIVPPNKKRSIRNITPPRQGGKEERISTDGIQKDGRSQEHHRSSVANSRHEKGGAGDIRRHADRADHHHHGGGSHPPKTRRSSLLWWGGGGVALLAVLAIVGFGVSAQFASVDVLLEPRSEEHTIDRTVTAYASPAAGELNFERMTMSMEEPRRTEIEVSGEEEVVSQASGTITIYNEHSSASQVLVENTRFESPDGLIFRIQERVTVPGMEGGEPGTLDVAVYADEAGPEYNIEPTRFTIPGFQGSPQFEGFYAESHSPMTGGEATTRPIVSDADMERARAELEGDTEEELVQRARESAPDNFILFDGAYILDEGVEVTTDSDGTSYAELEATLEGFIVDGRELARALFADVSDETDADIEITNWDNLSVAVGGSLGTDLEEISFTITGDVQFSWVVDRESLLNDLSGVRRGEMEDVLAAYPSIDRAEASFWPPWVLSFPGDADRIDIEISR